MLTYADACGLVGVIPERCMQPTFSTYADVCWRMLTYADACGLVGVIPERLHEANTIRHCALSLVGEPIIYPQINQFIRMLHAEGMRY